MGDLICSWWHSGHLMLLVYEKKENKTKLKQIQRNAVKVSAISTTLKLEIDARWDLSQKKTDEINGDIICLPLKSVESTETPACSYQTHRLQSLLLLSPALIDVSDVNRAGSGGDDSRSLIGSLSCCITQRHRLPLNVIITRSSPLPPH